jgi:hypothetical protein
VLSLYPPSIPGAYKENHMAYENENVEVENKDFVENADVNKEQKDKAVEEGSAVVVATETHDVLEVAPTPAQVAYVAHAKAKFEAGEPVYEIHPTVDGIEEVQPNGDVHKINA